MAIFLYSGNVYADIPVFLFIGVLTLLESVMDVESNQVGMS